MGVLVQTSRDSLRRFLTLFLGIDSVHYGYHQVLTFGRDIAEPKAKDLLTRFFQKLGRRTRYGNLTAIYTRERQGKSGHIHYHVRFMFFEKPLPFAPSLMVKQFGKEVYDTWNQLNGGGLYRKGNRMSERQHSGSYFIKNVEVPLTGKTVRGETTWWGRWHWKVLRNHYSEPPKEVVATALRRHINRDQLPKLRPYYSMAWLRKTKANVIWEEENCGGSGCEYYKHRLTRRKGKVSDMNFLASMNGENPWKRKKRTHRRDNEVF